MSRPVLIVELDGTNTDEVRGLDELAVEGSFINETTGGEDVQPSITIKRITFINDAARRVEAYRQGGLNGTTPGALEGIPVKIYAVEGTTTKLLFDGYGDFNDYEKTTDQEVTISLTKSKNLNSFRRIAGIKYFNILEEDGVFKNSDYVNIDYVVERPNAEGEIASLLITLTVLTTQAIQVGLDLFKELTANKTAHDTGGATGPAAGSLYFWLIIGINVVTFALIVIQIKNLINELAALLLPPKKQHKATFLHTLLEKSINHIGYSFETNITDMQNTAYLPARPVNGGSIISGVPKLGQPGQTVLELVNICLQKYDALLAIIGNTVHIRSYNDPFWIKNATYIQPDVGDEEVKALNLQSEKEQINIDDFRANRRITYAEDVTDEYTTRKWLGNSFLVVTEPINVNVGNNLSYDGLDEIQIPLALGTRKDELTRVEELLALIFTAGDKLVNALNAATLGFASFNSNFAGLIKNRKGALKLSQPDYITPKLIWLEEVSGRHVIPANHRDKLSAKVDYLKWHSRKSFVNTNPSLNVTGNSNLRFIYSDTNTPNYGGQKLIFIDYFYPLSLDEYLQLELNSYFATNNGKDGKIENVEYLPRENRSKQTYWVFQPWTKNLYERFIELK